MRLEKLAISLITVGGFALRLYYLLDSHPFFDEYTTVLAAHQILQYGWPILPSGLFYEHGLLSTYLIVPFTALFIDTPTAAWRDAQWGLMLARWPSLLLGTATIPLIYAIGRKSLGTTLSSFRVPISLLAAGLFAFSPEGMVWGGRARMYALATLLVLLAVYWAYRGALYPAPAKYRWLALLTLLATLLTQFGGLMLLPPLVVAMLVVGWYSWSEQRGRGAEAQRRRGAGEQGDSHTKYVSPLSFQTSRVWFLRPAVLLEGAVLAAIIGLAIFVKRLGRPLGTEALGSVVTNGNLPVELFGNTIAYQTTFYFTWADTLKFLARQFGVPHHFWLTLVTIMGTAAGLIFWLKDRRQAAVSDQQSVSSNYQSTIVHPFPLFLWVVFGLVILEMVTLLEPFRRNPRYIVMYLPLFYLIAAGAIFDLRLLFHRNKDDFTMNAVASRVTYHSSPDTPYIFNLRVFAALALLLLFTALGFEDLRVALVTPEPAYEKAFAHVHAEWQPGDVLLTMNTPAAGLYLGQVTGFTVQNQAEQFLLNRDANPVDRWLGAPWIGDAATFYAALNSSERTWFVIDTIRQPAYFQSDWLAVLNGQMEQVWSEDNALIYLTRPARTPLPTQPDTWVKATLGDSIQLIGYTLHTSPTQSEASTSPPITQDQSPITNHQSPIINLKVTLFWQTRAPLPTDYTVFLHLRDEEGLTVVQGDRLPLDGAYPTSRWQPGEMVIDPLDLALPEDLPAGSYELFAGLYRLDTLERLPVADDTTGENAILLGEVVLP